jgi:hypothetical protein
VLAADELPVIRQACAVCAITQDRQDLLFRMYPLRHHVSPRFRPKGSFAFHGAYSLIAVIATGKRITKEHLLEMALADVLALQQEVVGDNFLSSSPGISQP